ncbi:unnamed protein product [Brassica rapa subsp. trilocularis]
MVMALEKLATMVDGGGRGRNRNSGGMKEEKRSEKLKLKEKNCRRKVKEKEGRKSNYFLNAKGQDCQKTTSIKEKSTQDITSRKLSVCLK